MLFEPTRPEAIRQVLTDAHALLVARGWRRGVGDDLEAGPVCAGVAIYLAMDTSPAPDDRALWTAAADHFRTANHIEATPVWNDAPERTEAEVRRAFVHAIRLVS